MVKSKNSTAKKDVSLDNKVKLVMEMDLFKAGKSKYQTVRTLAKNIAGVAFFR